MDEIWELQIIRFVFFVGPATDKILEVQIVRFVVFAGHATDEILELQVVKLVAFAELGCAPLSSVLQWLFFG